ncbi:MAG: IscS subfamily cysteine desulfurase [Candidatus Binatia bacterium]|nr:IscS subfamily cysteine desulfurase [Candidatus Binatia bacterium]
MRTDRRVYMDHHATTPVDGRVLQAMLPYFCEKFGNAASRHHQFGWEAAEAVEQARAQVAKLINAEPSEIVFTSGATESNNLAIKGALEFYANRGNHVVTVATEHKSVLDVCRYLERSGKAQVTYVRVDRYGCVDPEDIRKALTAQTVMVSVMHANNEIGTIHELAEISRLATERGILFHTDATQSVGKIPVDVHALGADLLSLSAHKIYGPKGVGALYVRSKPRRVRLAPQIHGGGHERGLRSGTLNVPGIVGLGEACRIAREEMAQEAERLTVLRNRLHEGLLREVDDVILHGHPTRRLPGNLNVSFPGVEGESLLMALADVAVSSGAACTSTTLETSHVLRAIGVSEELAQSSIRFGLGRFNTEDDVDYVILRVAQEVRRLRALSPEYAASARQRHSSSQ